MSKPIGSAKTGGRTKGTQNKKTQHLFEVLDTLKFDAPERLVELLPKLSLEKQADILLNLMSYLYPKRKAFELTNLQSINMPQVILTMPDNGRSEKLDKE